MRLDYGKYKGVIFSVALFLLLDASVLMINFYTSFQISKDAVAVNLAGRQRMLSQRAMKAMLDMEVSRESPEKLNVAKQELANVANLFDDSLNAFDVGGMVQGAGTERVNLEQVVTADSRTAVDDTKVLWEPLYQKITQLLNPALTPAAFQRVLSEAIDNGKTNNLNILAKMNDLTVELENVATSKATRLRIIQTVGIVLAIINFFIIMVHFIRQLRESDEKVAAAQKQTTDILSTVDQGLFLLGDDLKISEQHSDEMRRIFGHKQVGGKGFINFIRGLVSNKDLENVERFFKLLFDPSKKQRLLGDLNPLKQVAIQIPDGNNGHVNKYLKFDFSRVSSDEGVDRVLTAVTDISQQVRLANELESVRNRNEQQLEMMSVLLNAEPELIPMFIQSSSTAYTKINHLLEDSSHTDREYRKKASDIFALIHNIKGEAGALSLDVIADLCHEFEIKIKSIQERTTIEGNDFLPLTVMLDQLMSYDTLLEEMHAKIYSGKMQKTADGSAAKNFSWTHLTTLANEVAERQDKKVELITAGLNDTFLESHFVTKLNSISVQLIRNAVTHGIEAPHARRIAKKPELGLISISFAVRSNGDFRYTFSDDGQGIDKNKLIESAVENNKVSHAEAQGYSLRQFAELMFKPNVTQQESADQDSGHGIGLYAVKTMVDELGGKISLKETPNRGVTFIISFPAACNQVNQAA